MVLPPPRGRRRIDLRQDTLESSIPCRQCAARRCLTKKERLTERAVAMTKHAKLLPASCGASRASVMRAALAILVLVAGFAVDALAEPEDDGAHGIPRIEARVVAAHIPGASALAQIDTFLRTPRRRL